MAKALLILTSLLLFAALAAAAEPNQFYTNLCPSQLGLREEKLTQLHFYMHDIVSGKNPTAVPIAEAATSNKSSTLFGKVYMMDDPLTVEPELSSKLVGSAQGIYASASQNDLGFLMLYNLVFTEGKFNGSTLSVLGYNPVSSSVDMPVVGGSGVFRFARGYAQIGSLIMDPKTMNAVVEYNVYVFHYLHANEVIFK